MYKWHQLNGEDSPHSYERIALHPKTGYVVYVKKDGKEEPLTSFQSIQVGQAVYLEGNKTEKVVWYDKATRALHIAGPADLLKSLLTHTMEEEEEELPV